MAIVEVLAPRMQNQGHDPGYGGYAPYGSYGPQDFFALRGPHAAAHGFTAMLPPPPRPQSVNSRGKHHHGHHRGGKRHHGHGGQQQGQQEGLPSLHQLRRDNLKHTKRHFAGAFGGTPRTVPRAPDNRSGYLLLAPGSALVSPAAHNGGFHAVTPNPFNPSTGWKNSFGCVDEDAAQFASSAGWDMLGTQDLLLPSEAAADDHAWEHDFDNDSANGDDIGEHPHQASVHAVLAPAPANEAAAAALEQHSSDADAELPAQARGKLDEQAAYIAQLEDENLTLRERIFLLEQQIKDLTADGKASPAPSHTSDEGALADLDEGSSGS